MLSSRKILSDERRFQFFFIFIKKSVVRISNFQMLYNLHHAQLYEVNLMNTDDLTSENWTVKKILREAFVYF